MACVAQELRDLRAASGSMLNHRRQAASRMKINVDLNCMLLEEITRSAR
jgi:hypothetical protein